MTADQTALSAADRAALLDRARAHRWFHRIRLAPDFETPGPDNTPLKLANLDALGLPARLDGKRVLDIGAWDGFFAFEMERRGATVVALDHVEAAATGFVIAGPLLGSRVEWKTGNLYQLDPAEVGTFDIVLCLGVIYHLRHILLGLDRVRAVMKPGADLFVETAGIENHMLRGDGQFAPMDSFCPEARTAPLVQIYGRGELGGDHTNIFVPNLPALEAMLHLAEFAMVGAAVAPEGFPSRIIAHARATDSPDVARWRDRDMATLPHRGWVQPPDSTSRTRG